MISDYKNNFSNLFVLIAINNNGMNEVLTEYIVIGAFKKIQVLKLLLFLNFKAGGYYCFCI